MTARPVTRRMSDARNTVIRWGRSPKAYYLVPADFAEFMATGPAEIDALFRGKPRKEPGHEGLPVRESTSERPDQKSRLYCTAGTGFEVPAA